MIPEELADTITMEEWQEEGRKRFGSNQMDWRFVCPICGHVASVSDWQKVGAPEGAVAFSCVGRWMKKCRKAFGDSSEGHPCDYSGGGLFKLNPVRVMDGERQIDVFAFAEPDQDQSKET